MQHSRHEKKQLEMAFPFLTWESETVSFPPHWHDCFEILLVTRGGLYVSVDDTIDEAAAGNLIMVNSGAAHGFFDPNPGTAILGMQFDITFFDESFAQVRNIVFQHPLIDKKTLKDEVYARLRQLLSDISHEYRKKPVGYQLAIKSKLYELLLSILRETPETSLKAPSSRAKQIRAFVYKHFDDPDLTLEEAALTFSLNKFYFIRFFKKHTGYSFHSYLTKTRIDFARRYLIESKMSITDVAFRSGFNSLQTFNRLFKSMTGFTPRDYRCECSHSSIGFGDHYEMPDKKSSVKRNF
jgi:AraC-like DNA-binding protein